MTKRTDNGEIKSIKTGKVSHSGSGMLNTGIIYGPVITNIKITEEQRAALFNNIVEYIKPQFQSFEEKIEGINNIVEKEIERRLWDINEIKDDAKATMEALNGVVESNFANIENQHKNIGDYIRDQLKQYGQQIDGFIDQLLLQEVSAKKEFLELKAAIIETNARNDEEKTLVEVRENCRLIKNLLEPQINLLSGYGNKPDELREQINGLKEAFMPLLEKISKDIVNSKDQMYIAEMRSRLEQTIRSETDNIINILKSQGENTTGEIKKALEDFKQILNQHANTTEQENRNILQILKKINEFAENQKQTQRLIKELSVQLKESGKDDKYIAKIVEELQKGQQNIFNTLSEQSGEIGEVGKVAKEVVFTLTQVVDSNYAINDKIGKINAYIEEVKNALNLKEKALSSVVVPVHTGDSQHNEKLLEQILEMLKEKSPIRLNGTDCERCGVSGAMELRCRVCDNTIVGGQSIDKLEINDNRYYLRRDGLLIIQPDDNGDVWLEEAKNKIRADSVRKILIDPRKMIKQKKEQKIAIYGTHKNNSNIHYDIRLIFPNLTRFALLKHSKGYILGKNLFRYSCVVSDYSDPIEFFGFQYVEEIESSCFGGLRGCNQTINDFINKYKLKDKFRNERYNSIWEQEKTVYGNN